MMPTIKLMMHCVQRMWRLLIMLVFTLSAGALAATETDPIVISISPFLAPQVLLKNYAPMDAYLNKKLGRSVSFVTAPDYRSYNDRILHNSPAFLIAISSSAQLAIEDKAYIPFLRPVNDTHPTLIVSLDSPIESVKDLRGRVVATTDAMGLVAMQTSAMLAHAGLAPGQDTTIRYLANHGAAINHVITHDVDAAVVSDRALAQMPQPQRQAVRVVADWAPGAAPGVVYLARSDIPAEQIAEITNALIDFVTNTAEGRALMDTSGYGGLKPTDAKELRFLSPFAAELRTLMKEKQ